MFSDNALGSHPQRRRERERAGLVTALDRAEASLSGDPTATTWTPSAAWSHLLQKLEAAAQIVDSDPVSRNRVDLASGMRHLLVLLAAGVDEALRFDPDPILSVSNAQAPMTS